MLAITGQPAPSWLTLVLLARLAAGGFRATTSGQQRSGRHRYLHTLIDCSDAPLLLWFCCAPIW